MDTIALGTDILIWPSRERVTRRYGTITVDRTADPTTSTRHRSTPRPSARAAD
jgi:hypothetical protein